MKTNFVRAALACVVLALTAALAAAGEIGDPTLPSADLNQVSVAIAKVPGPANAPVDVVGKGMTDSNGRVMFKDLAPGKYVLIIDGPGLVAAADKLAPEPEKKEESHSSFSVGIGGLFGSDSSRSSSGHPGAMPAKSSHESSSSTGMGIGLSVPIGQSDSDNDPAALRTLSVSVLVPQATRTWISGVGDDANPCSRTAPCKTFGPQKTRTWISGVGDDANPCSRTAPCTTSGAQKTRTWISGVGDDANPCSRTAPCTTSGAQKTRTWISGVGDDANPCSRTAPCKTAAGDIKYEGTTGVETLLNNISVAAPYCRDAMSHGMRVTFDVATTGSVQVGVALSQPVNPNATF